MALRTQRFTYMSRNETKGLTDVVARVQRNGVEVAASLTLTEVSQATYPGLYELVLSPALLTTYGGAGDYLIDINSVTAPAHRQSRRIVQVNNEDDLEAHLGIVEGKIDGNTASLSTANTNLLQTRAAVLDSVSGLPNIKVLLDQLTGMLANVNNTTRFVVGIQDELIKPGTGSNPYVLEMRLYDEMGGMQDPDGQVLVSVKSASGVDRTGYLTGTISNGKVPAVRDGVGIFHLNLAIPSTAPQEQITFSFDYVENGKSLNNIRSVAIKLEVESAGFAKETTAQQIKAYTDDMQPRVSDLQTKINDATSGVKAIADLARTIVSNTSGLSALLNDPTFGLATLRTQLDTKASQASVNANMAELLRIEGAGFDPTVHSLKAAYDRQIFSGGSVV